MAITADLKTKGLAQQMSHRCLHFFHEVSRAGGPEMRGDEAFTTLNFEFLSKDSWPQAPLGCSHGRDDQSGVSEPKGQKYDQKTPA